MPFATVTLTTAASSVPGASAAVALNWIGGKPTTVLATCPTATSSGFVYIQYTLDDLQRIGGSSLATWQSVSSAAGAPGTSYASTAAGIDGIYTQFLSPVAAVRINSTGLSSGPWTMKVIQGEGG
jgi:hypothetical protein